MPPKNQLTPEEKEDKKLRNQILYLENKVKGAWSWGHLKTFQDLFNLYEWYLVDGYRKDELDKELTFQDIKDFLEARRQESEVAIWLRRNPPMTLKISEAILEAIGDESLPDKSLPKIANLNLATAEDSANFKTKAEEEVRTYELESCSRDKAFLYWFQKRAVKTLLYNIRELNHRADLLIAATGSGKTFIVGAILARLYESKFHEGRTLTPWPYVYVTKASVVEQTQRVLKKYFGLTENEVLVINIDQLRSQFGKRFVKEEITVEDGVESYKWVWRPHVFPIAIIWDECQALKNHWSQQSSIAQAYNDIDSEHTYQLFVSATPFVRVSEAKCFVVATRVPYTFGLNRNAPMINEHWNDFAKNIASDYGRLDTKPENYSPGAMNRLMAYMSEYIHRVKGIKTQFKPFNGIKIINFETDKGRLEYENAWEEFQKEKARLEGDESLSSSQAAFNILAQLQVFLKAAETNYDRVHKIARDMFHGVQEGFASVAAVRFKLTICKVVEILIKDYGVKRDEIALIWGGAPVANKKQKLKRSILDNAAFLEQMTATGLTFEDLDLDEVEEAEVAAWPKEYRLGNQNFKERQKEIDKFQSGKALYCIYTFRAGGVGLSLHHTDDLTKEKVRHKESGYAYEEDILLIPTRPRKVVVTPTWSAIELVQGVGRCPRLTSLSDTYQIMEFYRGTVEERQARVVGVKLHCLSKVVRNRESWEDLIIGRKGMSEEEIETKLIKGKEETGEPSNGEDETADTWTGEDEEEEEE